LSQEPLLGSRMSIDNLSTASEVFQFESSASPWLSDFSVKFPKTPELDLILISADLYQEQEAHDILVLTFKGKSEADNISIVSSDPVEFKYDSAGTNSTFQGYVYQINPVSTVKAHVTEIWCVSASAVLKDSDQVVFKKVTADQVITKIAKKRGMTAVTQRHPRLRESIVQAGQTDWQIMRRLAKQTGFALRTENTTVFFVSKDKIYQDKKAKAPYFRYVDGLTKEERQVGTCFRFTPNLSDDSLETGVRVDRVMTGTNASSGGIISTSHATKDYAGKESLGKVVPSKEYFDAI
jgi:hypothetical protein